MLKRWLARTLQLIMFIGIGKISSQSNTYILKIRTRRMVGKLLYLSDLHSYMWSRDAYLVSILEYSSERMRKHKKEAEVTLTEEKIFLLKKDIIELSQAKEITTMLLTFFWLAMWEWDSIGWWKMTCPLFKEQPTPSTMALTEP